MTPRKIDKSHGFMQSIIKNQVLRDEFDKEQKGLATTKKNEETSKKTHKSTDDSAETKRNRTSRREPKQLYVPPHLKKRTAVEDDGQSQWQLLLFPIAYTLQVINVMLTLY